MATPPESERNEPVREGANKSIRTSGSVDALKQAFVDNLFYVQGRFMPIATPNDFYMALAYTVRDRILDRWIETEYLATSSSGLAPFVICPRSTFPGRTSD